jgi:hypothetical protein
MSIVSLFYRRSVVVTTINMSIVSLFYRRSVVITTINMSIVSLFYCDGQLYWCRKPEYQEKTINLPQVTDKLFT